MFWQFIKAKKDIYILYIIQSGFFCLTFYLYDLQFKSLRDAWLFSGYLLLCYSIISFIRYVNKQKKLQKLLDSTTMSLLSEKGFLPKAYDATEQIYQELLAAQASEIREVTEKNSQKEHEMLDDFGLWLHQIKTPVAALDLLIQSQPEPSVQMRSELFQINEYLQMMLNYLRQQLDSQDFVFEKINLELLLKQTVKKYAIFFSQKNLTLSLQNLDHLIITDGKWLGFILDQILSNAVKYTNDGTIEISYTESRLAIKDTGRGIRKEDLPRVFEKGYTGYNGRQQQRASGLGLYLSKMVADKIGCTLYVSSQIGEGTTVTISFPNNLNPNLQE